MAHDEYEMLIEYSEMTAFNFNSKEYQEVRKDYLECEKAANWFVSFMKHLVSRFKPQAAL